MSAAEATVMMRWQTQQRQTTTTTDMLGRPVGDALLQSSKSVEVCGNATRDGRGGVAAVLVATGCNNGNKGKMLDSTRLQY
jgi:hypothetical protein